MNFSMERDAVDLPIPSRPLKGFRRRWLQHQATSPMESGPSDEAAVDESNLFSPGASVFGDASHVDAESVPDGLETGEPFSDQLAAVSLQTGDKRPFDATQDSSCSDSSLKVLDPFGREPSWRAAALDADFKRLKSNFGKLPWELEGSAFVQSDRWHGTVFASFDKRFAITGIGVQDVWNSTVVDSRPYKLADTSTFPVVPISLKRSRREPLDEDIRCRALTRLQELLLQDPLATQLGTSLRGRLNQGGHHSDVEQSFMDCFRLKASTTLQKRAASLHKLSRCLRDIGQLHPLRMSEAQLYAALCNMRRSGSGATSAQHVIEALHFLDATAKLTLIDLSETVSARCRGVARDMYLTKDPLRQKRALTVEQVRKLETMMQALGTVFHAFWVSFCFASTLAADGKIHSV